MGWGIKNVFKNPVQAISNIGKYTNPLGLPGVELANRAGDKLGFDMGLGKGGGGPGFNGGGFNPNDPRFKSKVGLPQMPKGQVKLGANPSMQGAFGQYAGQLGSINDRLKSQVMQNARQQAGAGTDAIARRMAASGGLNSGAFMKMDQQQRDAAFKGGQEQAAQLDTQMQDQLASAGYNAANAQFQADLDRNKTQADLDFRQKVFNFEAGSKMKDLDNADRQFNLDLVNTDFNRRLAQFESAQNQPKKGLLGLGFMGL